MKMKKLINAKKCNGCREIFWTMNKPKYCNWGYKTEMRSRYIHPGGGTLMITELFPLEPCPKPMTYSQEVDRWELNKNK
jgi:hypothetical protein